MVTSDDDDPLFRVAMNGVRRAPPPQHVGLPLPRPLPLPRQSQADALQVMQELLAEPDYELLESGDTLQYRAPGVQEGVLRRLRRGHYRMQKELDLHGHNRAQAREAVTEFLAWCRDRDLRGVRIIHGKGNGSPNSGPVLKTYLDGWLRKRKDVLAFCSARPVDGGTGAVYVLLRGAG
ncbi:MAG TPA: Smr/MutS family protein [Solimonas sp.]|nr:Smr/MutS family protein [Solimonas sp.]